MGNSKRKGNRGEQAACAFFKEWTGYNFKRVPQSGGLRGHVLDYTVGDIICTDKFFENRTFPFCMEVKNHKEIDFSKILPIVKSRNSKPMASKLGEFWEQAKEDSIRAGKVPILMARYNGLPSGMFFVVLDRRTWKGFKFPMDRILTRDWIILTTQTLETIDFKKFLKHGVRIWKKQNSSG